MGLVVIAPEAANAAKIGTGYHTRHDSQNQNIIVMYNDLQQVADLVAKKLSYCCKEVLTTDECSEYLGISKSCLYKLCMLRQIPHFKSPAGKMSYFNRHEVEAWAQSARVATEEELSGQAAGYSLNRKGGRL